jgi:hypothetical protein
MASTVACPGCFVEWMLAKAPWGNDLRRMRIMLAYCASLLGEKKTKIGRRIYRLDGSAQNIHNKVDRRLKKVAEGMSSKNLEIGSSCERHQEEERKRDWKRKKHTMRQVSHEGKPSTFDVALANVSAVTPPEITSISEVDDEQLAAMKKSVAERLKENKKLLGQIDAEAARRRRRSRTC